MGTKRMNYFTGEFLNEKDFKDEQQYHIDMLKKHNKNLHSWGIAKGLNIVIGTNRKSVIIESGMAIDAEGRQIIVESNREKNVPDNVTEKELYLTISYRETRVDSIDNITGMEPQYTRIEEEPHIEFFEKSDFDTSMTLLLAKVILDNNETISKIDQTVRKYAGIKDEDTSISFDPIKGHKHTGTAGDGPVISHGNLDSVLAANTTSTDAIENKHVSDALAKSWQDHIMTTSGNPHGTTAAQLSDYLSGLYIGSVSFEDSDRDGTKKTQNVGFVPKLVLISGGFYVELGGAMHGSTFSGFWANGNAACSYPTIYKYSSTDIRIYSQIEDDLFHFYVYYNDPSTKMIRPKHETIYGSIEFSGDGIMTVTLSRSVQGKSDPIDSFSITLSMLCVG
jgi:hypothetical protein